jgi:hypothetical protein
MQAAARNVLIVITLSILGLILAMNLPQSANLDNGIVLPSSVPENMASANTAVELVSSVDWSKIKAEPAAPTF